MKLKFGRTKKIVEYVGEFSSFETAAKRCVGYDSQAIFDKVCFAAQEVIKGNARYERDSYLFFDNAINYNLMFYLQKLYIAEGRIDLCDVGGALASTFFQHRLLLESMKCNWTVMEQRHFVDWANNNINIQNLKFMYLPTEYERMKNKFNCMLFSSVLQYIEDYEKVISTMLDYEPSIVILERTPVSSRGWSWIEKVHEPIYEASYPAYVFEEKALVDKFINKGYKLIDSWHSLVDGDELNGKDVVEFKSFVFAM